MGLMKRTMLVGAVAALGLGSAGCESVTEAVDPCAAERACEVDGVDLAITEVTIDYDTVSEINRPAIPVGATVQVSYTVLNRGSEDAPETQVEVCDGTSGGCYNAIKSADLAVLEPGETSSGTIELILPEDVSGDRKIRVAVARPDAESGNNEYLTNVLIEHPNLVPTVELLEEEEQVGSEISAVVTIENRAYVADAPKHSASVCLQDIGSICIESIPPSWMETSALGAGDIQVDTIAFSVPVTALRWPDQSEGHGLLVCADAKSSVEEGFEGEKDNCVSGTFTALPNFELACGATAITNGEAVSGVVATTDCKLYSTGYADLYRFDATANAKYVITADAFNATDSMDELEVNVVTDRGGVVSSNYLGSAGESVTVTIGQEGTYYLAISALFGAKGQEYTITLEES